MLKALALSVMLAAVAALPASAANVQKEPPSAPYKKVCTLVKLPCFIPSIGTLYVQPKTIPEGPWLAYDHKGRLVSTIYMIPIKDFDSHKVFADLAAPGGRVDHVSIDFNAGHPGVEEPHYHIVLWHVSKAQESLVAK
ncbi:MAG: hypothetical protein KGJ66_10485 [Alphaproteobacteria bacterium]|nr:hypothetical protein [Alphaproteobacteria bacterium]